MGACTECRKAKVKCDQIFPCRRCQRLRKICQPHVSRQGQNPSRRISKKQKHNNNDSNDDAYNIQQPRYGGGGQAGCNNTATTATAATIDESDAITCHMIGDSRITKGHYGLQCLVRTWIALSLRRRSFQLWSRAGMLAVQCGMSMDDILCENMSRNSNKSSKSRKSANDSADSATTSMAPQRGMDFLYPFLLTPKEDQTVVGPPLELHEIPSSLWRSVGIATNDQGKVSEEHFAHRWIWVRQTKQGLSRFYASPGFEKHIVSNRTIQETYQANKQQINDLFIVKNDDKNTSRKANSFVRAFAHQVSYNSHPGIVPKPTRLSNVRIRTKTPTKGTGESSIIIQEVDLLWCMTYPDTDESYGLSEFIPPSLPTNSLSSTMNNEVNVAKNDKDPKQASASTVPKEWRDEVFDEDLTINVDDIDEENFEWKMVYELLSKKD